MRILLVRHGESEGNVDATAYIKKGDRGVGLTDTGWQQAIGAGNFLKDVYKGAVGWPVVYISSYQRTKETFRGLYEGIKGNFPQEPKLYEDPRLIEKFFGAASHLHHPAENLSDEEKLIYSTILDLSKKVNHVDPFTSSHLFGNSTKDTLTSVKNFLDGTFKRDCDEGKKDFLFVTHGAVIQAFLMSWAHLPMDAKNKVGNPHNCDVISIEGTPKNWTIRKIYDGEKFEAVDIEILKNIKPFSIDDLPPLSAQFQPK